MNVDFCFIDRMGSIVLLLVQHLSVSLLFLSSLGIISVLVKVYRMKDSHIGISVYFSLNYVVFCG